MYIADDTEMDLERFREAERYNSNKFFIVMHYVEVTMPLSPAEYTKDDARRFISDRKHTSTTFN